MAKRSFGRVARAIALAGVAASTPLMQGCTSTRNEGLNTVRETRILPIIPVTLGRSEFNQNLGQAAVLETGLINPQPVIQDLAREGICTLPGEGPDYLRSRDRWAQESGQPVQYCPKGAQPAVATPN